MYINKLLKVLVLFLPQFVNFLIIFAAALILNSYGQKTFVDSTRSNIDCSIYNIILQKSDRLIYPK
jgi:hypothetical protein